MAEDLCNRIARVEQAQIAMYTDLQELKGQLQKLMDLVEGLTKVESVEREITGLAQGVKQPHRLVPFQSPHIKPISSPIPHSHTSAIAKRPHGLVPFQNPHIQSIPSPLCHNHASTISWMHAPQQTQRHAWQGSGPVISSYRGTPSDNIHIPIERRNKKLKQPEVDPIPMTYSELYKNLLQAHMVAPTPLEPIKQPYPEWYNPSDRCEYHAGVIGHNIENCVSFKRKVQSMRDARWLNFSSVLPKSPSDSSKARAPCLSDLHQGILQVTRSGFGNSHATEGGQTS